MINDIKKTFKTQPLRFFELLFLSLMLFSLPSIEAPKNIFGFSYMLIAGWRIFKSKIKPHWDIMDIAFLGLIISFLLSALFGGIHSGAEWKGFRGIVTWILFGVLISKSIYTDKEIKFIYTLTIISTIPPLAWGLIENKILETNVYLQLHSVGHVNHSAIYLTIIFGASLGLALSNFQKSKNKIIYVLLPVIFFISIIIMQSRAALSTSTIVAILLISLSNNEKYLKIKALAILASLILGIFIFNANVLEKQLNNQRTGNILASRDIIQNTSIIAFKAYPIFGVGNGNWNKITRELIESEHTSKGKQYIPSDYMVKNDAKTAANHAHSIYFASLSERGIVGIISLLFFMFIWMLHLITNYKSIYYSNKNTNFVWAASFSSFLATFLIGFANSTFHHEHALLALLFIGLCKIKTSILKN
jgi:O-antigen ligase